MVISLNQTWYMAHFEVFVQRLPLGYCMNRRPNKFSRYCGISSQSVMLITLLWGILSYNQIFQQTSVHVAQ